MFDSRGVRESNIAKVMIPAPPFSSWIDILRGHASRVPDKLAYTFLPDGKETGACLTFRELESRARAIAATLQSLGMAGERALLLYPPGLDYVTAFVGCLFAGVVAVPAYPVQSRRARRMLPRLHSILSDSKPSVIMTLSSLLEAGQAAISEMSDMEVKQWLATDRIGIDLAGQWREPSIGPERLAFLQYTSGSTTIPKGVMITHHNLIQNESIISRAFDHTEQSSVVGWLPLYHDMGLIGNVLQPLFRGMSCVLMPPLAFLQHPVHWLSAISKYRATTSGGPNFGYELCVQKITEQDRLNLDLSCWKVAYNGAEPVRPDTLARFTEAFSPCGFRREAFHPCYGLAEATLMVTGGKAHLPPVVRAFRSDFLEQGRVQEVLSSHPKARILVGCGQSFPGQTIKIVDPAFCLECDPGTIGEIWVAGESVAPGYWGRAGEPDPVFSACMTGQKNARYLRTGDLGFFLESELFVTGRLKDLIIIRGRNHYPQDIELTMEKAHPALRSGAGAAFSLEIDGYERLVVVQEVERQHRNADLQPVIDAIREAIAEAYGLSAYAVVLLKPGTIPKTSSGKIQRYACRLGFVQKSLESLQSDVVCERTEIPHAIMLSPEEILSGNPADRESSLIDYLIHYSAQITKLDPGRINPEKSLASQGFDSLAMSELIVRIEIDFGIIVPIVELFEAKSLTAFARELFPRILRKQFQSTLLRNKITWIGSQQQREQSTESTGVRASQSPAEIRTFPASPEQQSLWLLHQAMEAISNAYNILVMIRFRGRLKVGALEESMREIVWRHEILHTTYLLADGKVVQVCAASWPFDFPVIDLDAIPESERGAEMSVHAREQARWRFDLEKGPMIRPVLYRLAPQECVLAIVMHHIACDGWSIRIFIRELSEIYQALSENKTPSLPELPGSYIAVVRERDRDRDERFFCEQLEYWRNKLAQPLPERLLPTDHPRRDVQEFESAQEGVFISRITYDALKAMARQHEVTPFMALLAVFKVLLFRFSGQADVLVGSSVVNRNNARERSLIGPFTNAIALRTDLAGTTEFDQVLDRVRRTALEAYAHQDMPFDRIVRELRLSPQAGQTSLFEAVFLLQNFLDNDWRTTELAADFEEFDTGMSNFDLALIFYERSGELFGSIKYRAALFDRETICELARSYEAILKRIIDDPRTKLTELEISEALRPKAELARILGQQQTIAISATFTSEPLEAPLRFWMRELDIPARIVFAPYHQVFQQLLDPQGLLSENRSGINLVLLRISDWAGTTIAEGVNPSCRSDLRRNVEELVSTLKAAARRAHVPFLVALCPSRAGSEELPFLREQEEWLQKELEGIKAVHVIEMAELLSLYPVSKIFDPTTEKAGGVPFTSEFFIALGTMVARKIHTIKTMPYKVIVLDCDQTLWDGVCGEDGPDGIGISPARRALQEFFVAQHETGMLLCLCSKNDERDVEEVFRCRKDLPLKLEHFAARKINWKSKSDNLKVLAEELGLAQSSFIFVDDSVIECAEVQAACPAVLPLQLPGPEADVAKFLQHAWVFDRLAVTKEDRQRTELYRQNLEREHLRQKTLNLEEFLAGLQLQCEIRAMRDDEASRVSQLTQRTNQFNTTGIRYSIAEVQRWRNEPRRECFAVAARDRFGDYGLVGVMLIGENASELEVEAFLLSCRALGRGIEYRMLSYLGELGVQRAVKQLAIRFVHSGKNQPAFDFLCAAAGECRNDVEQKTCFRLTARKAMGATPRQRESDPIPMATPADGAIRGPQAVARQAHLATVMRIAGGLRDVAEIEAAMSFVQRSKSLEMSLGNGGPPTTPTEHMLASIWSKVLSCDRAGIRDNFFELGGNSLTGTVVISRIRDAFEVELPLHLILEKPTIAQLSEIIDQELIAQSKTEDVAEGIKEIELLSDEEVKTLLAMELRSLETEPHSS